MHGATKIFSDERCHARLVVFGRLITDEWKREQESVLINLFCEATEFAGSTVRLEWAYAMLVDSRRHPARRRGHVTPMRYPQRSVKKPLRATEHRPVVMTDIDERIAELSDGRVNELVSRVIPRSGQGVVHVVFDVDRRNDVAGSDAARLARAEQCRDLILDRLLVSKEEVEPYFGTDAASTLYVLLRAFVEPHSVSGADNDEINVPPEGFPRERLGVLVVRQIAAVTEHDLDTTLR